MKNKLNLLIFFLFISLNIFSQDKIEFDFSSSALDETAEPDPRDGSSAWRRPFGSRAAGLDRGGHARPAPCRP